MVLWLASGSRIPKRVETNCLHLASGGFLFLSALEYDNKIFRNLSKIGGSEFSVEFSTQSGEKYSSDSTPIDTGHDFLAIALPGTTAVELSLNHLVRLPQYIMDDERYSVAFSTDSTNVGQSVHRLRNPIFQMPLLTKQYLLYSCNVIATYTSELLASHDTNQGEFSVLNTPSPEIVLGLLSSYFKMRDKTEQENLILMTRVQLKICEVSLNPLRVRMK